MTKTACNCPVCVIATILLIVGALNGGISVLAHVNLIDKVFSHVHMARAMYVLIALAGLAAIVPFFKNCPGCKK